jgi:hypothetical protein
MPNRARSLKEEDMKSIVEIIDGFPHNLTRRAVKQ